MTNPNQFLKAYKTPIRNNAEEYLKSLRFYGLQKTDGKTEYTMMQDCSVNPHILPISVYLDLEKEREERMEAMDNSEEFLDSVASCPNGVLTESIHIHNKALFDGFNDALDTFRLYKQKGEPMPWNIEGPLKLFHDGDANQRKEIEQIFNQAISRLKEWTSIR
mmetsp:Transcript_25793/g.29731  ORF Transcript_25793/g.29731 Transcript_25793/m.29731 type:complete len:163 (-) Transcript_25793:240-728(-)